MGDVVVDRREHGLWLQLNRPERMNAYDRNTIDELVAAFREHVDARVVVITGTNGAFCAGGYLANLTTPDFWELRSLFMGSLELFDTIRNAPMPVIAAVNGGAFGGGNELVVCCDLAIAAESAQLGQTGVRVGSAPVLGGTNLLAMTVGEKRAKEVSFLCRKYSAKQAMDLGWINHVVPDDELEDEVDRWCQELAAMSPRYMELAKASSNVMYHQFRDNMVQGLNSLIQAIGSSDMKEGAAAFMDKRRPDFSPRDEL
ncbi:MAG: dihydroxynaphthoic acid synthetase [Acidobacteria bacterium]|jgi:enoyl-CoA hydratase/carnithine racemase|nr:dihydroxynaphthoic acid synthetase [Acidobacteriota bacterium]|tara:strand:- start:3871 stop:4641 length:771 start_codon:yes stop_codon:yes gene_type:complete